MKMEFKKKMAFTFAAIALSVLSYAQTGIGTFNPDKSARLDIYSDKTGFLMPRVALIRTTQQNPITAPATSLMVYNTATSNDVTPGYYYWDGQKWTRIAKSDEFTFNNGLTATNGNVQLGGTLTQPSTLTTTAASTLSIKGLQTGAAADNILVADANGVLKAVTRTSLGDNLGNHTATQDLTMSGNNITNALNITATGKTTTQTAQITKGTDGNLPIPGSIATAADASGNIIWTTLKQMSGSLSGVYEFLGTNTITVPAGTTTNVPMNGNSFELDTSAKVLITYSLLPLPANAGQPVQGSIDLMVDDNKTISSYYSAWDAPSVLVKLGNYSTAQKVISLPAGTHTVGINLKSWINATTTNVNPFNVPYGGAIQSDSQAMVARITVIVFND